jgi:hypothetical protein
MMFHVYDPLSRSSVDMVGRLAWLPFGRNPLLYASDGIRKASWKVRRHHRLLQAAAAAFVFCG